MGVTPASACLWLWQPWHVQKAVVAASFPSFATSGLSSSSVVFPEPQWYGVGMAVPFRAEHSVSKSRTSASYALHKSFSCQAWEQLRSVGLHTLLLFILFFFFLLLISLWLSWDSLRRSVICCFCLLVLGLKVYHHSWTSIHFWKASWPSPFSRVARAGSILGFRSGFYCRSLSLCLWSRPLIQSEDS